MAPSCYHRLHLFPATVAHTMAYFLEEGIADDRGSPDYKVIEDNLSPFGLEHMAISSAVSEKDIDVVLDIKTESVFYARKYHGADLKIIAGWRVQQPMSWIVLDESIRDIQDLRGKRIGIVDRDGITHNALKRALSRGGLEPDRDVTFVPKMSRPYQIDALKAGDIDCTWCDTHEVAELGEQGIRSIIDIAREFPEGRADRVLAAPSAVIESKSEAVRAFLRALIRSYWFIRDQPRNFEYVRAMEKGLRSRSDSEYERRRFIGVRPEHLRHLPFPMDGGIRSVDPVLKAAVERGSLQEYPSDQELESGIELGLVQQAFVDLEQREELAPDLAAARMTEAELGF